MDPKIDTVTLGVTDLGRTLEFYERGFAFPLTERPGDRVKLELGGSSALELREWDALASDAGMSPKGTGFRGFTLSYIVAESSGVDDMLARLVRAGGKIAKEPRFAFWGYSAHVADPSGHLWKIASPKRKSLLSRKTNGNGVPPEPVPAQELALTIGVADMKRAKQFYEDGLGNPTKKDYSKFVSFDGGDGTPDLALYKWDALADDADVPPDGSGFRGFEITHVVDSADAVARLLDKAGRAGGKIVKRPVGDGSSGYFTDVDGYLWRIAARSTQKGHR
jgi:catechol 2,3-dioxygenase-like lactoylglutathione lyase family enzyme